MFVRLSQLYAGGRTNNIVDRIGFRWNPLILTTIAGALLVISSIYCICNFASTDIRMFVRLSQLYAGGRTNNIVDRIGFRWNPLILTTIAGALLVYWMWGSPMTCWAPAHFTPAQVAYTQSFCWTTRNIYPAITNITLPRGPPAKSPIMMKRAHLWLPFILLVMAIVSTLPHWVWSIFIAGSDVKLDNLSAIFRRPKLTDNDRKHNDRKHDSNQDCDVSMDCQPKTSQNNRNKTLDKIINAVYTCVMSMLLPRHDVMFVLAYMIVKILNLVAIITQIRIIESYLTYDTNPISTTSILANFKITGFTIPPSSDMFPDMILCDFSIRRMAQLQNFTIQCLMNVNYFSRGITAFVTSWLLVVHAFAVADITVWVVRLCVVGVGTVYSAMIRVKPSSAQKGEVDNLAMEAL